MEKPLSILKRMMSAGLVILASYLPFGCASFKPQPRKNPVYEYALSKGLEGKLAESLTEKLDSLDYNSQEFIDIISRYPSELQNASVNSDILDNKHVSKKELENTRKASLEGIVNPQEIYAVLANGFDDENGYSITDVLFFYKMLKKNNVSDENIALLLYNELNEDYTNTNVQKQLRVNPTFIKKEPIPCTFEELTKTNLAKLLQEKSNKEEIDQTIKEYASLTKEDIKADIEKATGEKFLKSIKSLKSDYNDRVYIFYIAHGQYLKEKDEGLIGIGGDVITTTDLNKAISNIDYDRLIFVGSSCYSAGILKNLNRPEKIKNTLAIASAEAEKEAPADEPIRYIIKYEKYDKISDILNEKLTPKVKAIPFYFDPEKKECSWLDEPFIESQK